MSRSLLHFIQSNNRNVKSNIIKHNIIRWSLSLSGLRTKILAASMLMTDLALSVTDI